MKLTRLQREALFKKYKQAPDGSSSYIEFRRRLKPTMDESVMLRWCGMWLGIETDGYTHS